MFNEGLYINSYYKLIKKLMETALWEIWEANSIFYANHFMIYICKVPISEIDKENYEKIKSDQITTFKSSSPNLYIPFEFGEYENHFYLSLPQLESANFGKFLDDKKTLPFIESLTIILDIANAVSVLNSYNLSHGLLTPENIWIKYLNKDTPQIKLSSYGVSSILKDFNFLNDKLYKEQIPYLHYKTLERKSGSATSCTDLYSIGVIFYRLLTGSFPYKSTAKKTYIELQKKADINSIKKISNPEIPDEAKELIYSLILCKSEIINIDTFISKIKIFDALKNLYNIEEKDQHKKSSLNNNEINEILMKHIKQDEYEQDNLSPYNLFEEIEKARNEYYNKNSVKSKTSEHKNKSLKSNIQKNYNENYFTKRDSELAKINNSAKKYDNKNTRYLDTDDISMKKKEAVFKERDRYFNLNTQDLIPEKIDDKIINKKDENHINKNILVNDKDILSKPYTPWAEPDKHENKTSIKLNKNIPVAKNEKLQNHETAPKSIKQNKTEKIIKPEAPVKKRTSKKANMENIEIKIPMPPKTIQIKQSRHTTGKSFLEWLINLLKRLKEIMGRLFK